MRRQPGRRDFFEEGKVEQQYDERGLPKMFHGTANEISHDVVMPSSVLPKPSKWEGFYDDPKENWRKDRIFASQHERSAWHWGQGKGRLRVHELRVNDPKMVPGSGGEWHGSAGLVKKTEWTPPPPAQKPDAWVQGTLPPHNWGEGQNWRHSEDSEPSPEPEKRNLHPQQFAGQRKLFK